MQESFKNTPQGDIEKKKSINKYWDDPDFKIEVKGELLTLKECYDRQIAYSDRVFELTKKLTDEIVPEGKYILFINSAKGGTVEHPDINLVDQERLKKMYRMETGSEEVDPENFQANNMRRCLGFEKGDPRFKVINAYDEEIPKDLSDCVGVVFSGSRENVLVGESEEEDEAGRVMKAEVREFMQHTHEQEIDVPKLCICFGGQLSAEVYADAEIEYVADEYGNKSRIQGVNEIYKTMMGNFFHFWGDLPSTIYVPQDHGQKIKKMTINAMQGEVLAENINGDVEVLYLKRAEALVTQFHPEAGSIRMDISESLYGNRISPEVLFKNDTDKVREVFFTTFIKTIGRYLELKNKRS